MGKIDSTDNSENMINLYFEKEETQTDQVLEGRVSITYEGRFDSISINSQIEGSSDVFTYIELQGKKINHPYARLPIMKKEILEPKNIQFKVKTLHVPSDDGSMAKFRATLIQEHKEIGSAVKFIRIKKGKD
ncbi:hypothetical protein [Candidatus Nitrosocosmicus franklandus]|uniref:Uncharacterized protein n=1 Tax=Candidatus Nitrosocosmicus franklandianus TaxID=1798806 RepID=A0A484I7S0_9ARCH|nr:hypothetical protein [Candidatus Nitrosocosmicus franklandus]VFJ13231.1 conserved protein of unknown function [Candidatus Nitrosocosmicus franklandus]